MRIASDYAPAPLRQVTERPARDLAGQILFSLTAVPPAPAYTTGPHSET
jgi:hypothetical protein